MAADDSAHSDGRIVLEEREGVAVITLDRPDMRNAMSTAMWRELETVCRGLAARGDGVGAVVLRGEGPSFCAGMDLYEMHRLSLDEVEESFKAMDRAIRALEELPVPTIGLLRGVAAGGGCQLLLGCDIRVAARTARLGMPVARLGITVGPDFAQRLMRLIGVSRTRDMLFTGRLVRATEACRWGLINYVVHDNDVEERGFTIAQRIASHSPASNRWSKVMTEPGAPGSGPANGVPAEPHRYAADPEDFREGLQAWVERREPVFRKRGGGAG